MLGDDCIGGSRKKAKDKSVQFSGMRRQREAAVRFTTQASDSKRVTPDFGKMRIFGTINLSKRPKRSPKWPLTSHILTMSTLARSKRLCPTAVSRSRSSSVTFLGCTII